ncbi:MAG: protein kinase [Gemmataceae bacterium]
MSQITHPAIDRLVEYGLGRLSTAESDEIESHLSTCDTCRNHVASTPDDRLVSLVRLTRPSPESDLIVTRSEFDHVRPFAQGGLGVIDLAKDRHFRRDVAVKRIRPELADHAPLRKRFLREAAITARLEHPGIAPVYGVGEDRAGQPCYAMRFVAGETMQDAIRALHVRGTISNTSLRPLLNRFISLCNTVAYANSRNVIHRDIKPANVAIGAFGETILLDWGLAQAEGEQDVTSDSTQDQAAGPFDPVHTQTGAVLGTPGFIAPEQKRGETVGPAADVYSLGATLLVILTGRSPNDEASQASQTSSFAPLFAIAHKAMANQPGDRYVDALSLARDIENWLADEPVIAHPDSALVILRRWSRRHRTAVTSIAGALFVATVASISAAAALSRKNDQLQSAIVRANDNETLATNREKEATQNFNIAVDSVDAYTLRVTEDRRLKEHDMIPLRKELLESATEFYRRLLNEKSESLVVRSRLGSTHNRLASILYDTGDVEAAEREYHAALTALDAAEDPNSEQHLRERYDTWGGLAQVYFSRNRYNDTIDAFQRANDALRLAVKSNPSVSDRSAFSHLAASSAAAVAMAGRPQAEVDEAFSTALRTAKEDRDHNPSELRYTTAVINAYYVRGVSRKHTGRREDARADWLAARGILNEIDRNVVNQNPKLLSHRSLVEFELGMSYRTDRKFPEAASAFEEGSRAAAALMTIEPRIASHQSARAVNLFGLGSIYTFQNKNEAADSALRSAIEVQRVVHVLDPKTNYYRHSLVSMYVALAKSLTAQNRLLEAVEQAKSAEQLLRPIADDTEIGRNAVVAWCRIARDAKQPELIKQCFDHAMIMCKQFAGCNQPDMVIHMLNQVAAVKLFDDPTRAAVLKDKEFDSLRNRPDFQKLLSTIGKKHK